MGYTWSVPVDATAMLQDSNLATALPDLSEELRDQPEQVLNAMALAFHTVCISQCSSNDPVEVGHIAIVLNQNGKVLIDLEVKWGWGCYDSPT